jgi:hypothetical protein
MSRKRSIHIGLARVGAGAYKGGWIGFTRHAARDAEAMRALAHAEGFEAQALITEAATRKAVEDAVLDAAATLDAGDLLVWSYAGHGARVPDQGPGHRFGGDEERDQSWCLYDGFLLDDEIRDYLTRFRRGVRVLLISDSCFSGTMTSSMSGSGETIAVDDGDSDDTLRAMPAEHVHETMQAHGERYQPIRDRLAAASRDVAASVLLLAACGDNAFAFEGDNHGKFTGALLETWASGSFDGDHRELHAAIAARTGRQVPVLLPDGEHDPLFERMVPFTLRPARGGRP